MGGNSPCPPLAGRGGVDVRARGGVDGGAAVGGILDGTQVVIGAHEVTAFPCRAQHSKHAPQFPVHAIRLRRHCSHITHRVRLREAVRFPV